MALGDRFVFKQFTTTYFVNLSAKILAGITAVVFGLLGYYSDVGAFLLAWAPYATPELARIVFWVGAGAVLIVAFVLPWFFARRMRTVWAERNQLELSAIACLSVGTSADAPYDNEPQLSRHRSLKDAVRSGVLKIVEMQGDKPNVHTLIAREDLRQYATAQAHPDLLSLLKKWDRLNPPHTRNGFVEERKVKESPQTETPSIVAPAAPKSALKLAFGEEGQFQNISKHSLYKITRQFCVRIVNDSPTETVSACKVQITAIEPWTGAKLPRILKDGFTLASGDSTFIPLASYGEAREQEKYACGDTLIEVLGGDRPIAVAHDQRSIITIRATAVGAPFCEEKCAIWVDTNGRLKICSANEIGEAKAAANRSMRGQVQHNIYKNGSRVSVGPPSSQFDFRFSVASQNRVHVYKDRLTYLARVRGKTTGDVLKLSEYPDVAASFVVATGEHFIAMKDNGQMFQGKIIEVKDDRSAEHDEVTFEYVIAPVRGGDFLAL